MKKICAKCGVPLEYNYIYGWECPKCHVGSPPMIQIICGTLAAGCFAAVVLHTIFTLFE